MPVTTDPGAFQQHAYGSVEVTPEEIPAFQNTIGSDIATVLDVFTEPEDSYEETETRPRGDCPSRSRATGPSPPGPPRGSGAGRVTRGLEGPVRGTASEVGDVLAVGGVVPLMEQYRFPELVRVLSRPDRPSSRRARSTCSAPDTR